MGPQSRELTGSLPNHMGESFGPSNHSRLLYRPLKPTPGSSGSSQPHQGYLRTFTVPVLTPGAFHTLLQPSHLVPRPLPYHFLPHQGPPPSNFPNHIQFHMLHQGPSSLLQAAPPSPTRAITGSKGEAFPISSFEWIVLLSPPWILPHLRYQYSWPSRALSPVTPSHQGQPHSCTILSPPEPNSPNITEFSLPEYLPHQTPLSHGPSPLSILSAKALPLRSSPLSWSSPAICPGPLHNGPSLPASTPPGRGWRAHRGLERDGAPGSGRASGRWRWWLVSRRPPVPAPAGPGKPRGGEASGTGGPVVTATPPPPGAGKKETKGQPGACAGKGRSRWTGEGEVNPRGPPSAATLPRGTRRPAPT